MKEFDKLKELAEKIKDSKKKVTLLYAFNGTGKTRLSMKFRDLVNRDRDDDTARRIIYYNAFTEDLFSWDNDLEYSVVRKLKINKNSTFIDFIKNQGKENEIAEKFKK